MIDFEDTIIDEIYFCTINRKYNISTQTDLNMYKTNVFLKRVETCQSGSWIFFKNYIYLGILYEVTNIEKITEEQKAELVLIKLEYNEY